jgi:hypothetical protein
VTPEIISYELPGPEGATSRGLTKQRRDTGRRSHATRKGYARNVALSDIATSGDLVAPALQLFVVGSQPLPAV